MGLLQSHRAGLIELTTTVEVLQELTHVYSRRRSRSLAVDLARNYAAAFALLVTQPRDLELGLQIYEATPQLGAFDAVLAAVAINHQAEALISADQAFGEVRGLPWIELGSSDLLRL